MGRLRCWKSGFVVALAVVATGSKAVASEAVSAARPLQTELIGPLDLRAHDGSSVLVRVALEWSEPGCKLVAGSIVQGRVVSVIRRSKVVRDSEIAVRFDAADCDGHAGTARGFTLVALVGPSGSTFHNNQSGVSEGPPLADAVGLAIAGGIRSASAASAITDSSLLPVRSLPSRILPGQVVDLAKVNLGVGTAADGATTITGVRHDLRLERGTSLILVPRPDREVIGAGATPAPGSTQGMPGASVPRVPGAAATAGGEVARAGTGAVVGSPGAPVTAEPADETEICSGVCSVASVGSVADQASLATGSVPIGRLGFAPRDKHQATSFDDETTLTYLDANNLLCTFDPHQLRQRGSGDDEATHTVRAVLLDPSTHTIKRVVEWRVRGDDHYIWRLAGGRVLVHMGRELRLFDAGLRPVRSLPLEGRVAWVVSSPSGDHIAVGTVKERYTEAVYRELQTVLAEDPEEDLQVRVFDAQFNLLVSTVRSSKSPIPVLSDAGELRVRGVGRDRWRMTEYGWDRLEHTVATAKSTCRPLLSTPEHGLIFAVGCTATGGRWYRMLRQDGHPLLKGESPSDEIEQTARSSAAGDFAVRIVRATRPMSYGQPFSRVDLTKEEIAIYRSSDGATLAALTTDDFALAEQAFALSPGGDQMALLGSRSILFYAVKR